MIWPAYRMPACMGGWSCPMRDSCRHYHAADRRDPVERLCGPVGHDLYEPIPRAKAQAAAPEAVSA